MTLLKILKVFIDQPDLPLRPSHVAKLGKIGDKTAYRGIRILEKAKLLTGSDGLFWIDPKTSKEYVASLDRNLSHLDILRILLPGKPYNVGELVALTGKSVIGNALATLVDDGWVIEPPNLPGLKKDTTVALSSKINLALANSQFQREKFRRVYGS